ncbi:MAG TPA: dihydrolipoamide acetyltransferase family protein [Solirubrobacteraceae bacterium]|nr:dihydrolipoamide acetyltransferase family protein [Solirubrobacteraceae bacterium]
MADIVMPRLSDTMEEGTILRWLKRDGEEVRRGEELVEIETDKATMIYESDQQGVLQIRAPEGATLPVGEIIALVGSADGLPATANAPSAPSVTSDAHARGVEEQTTATSAAAPSVPSDGGRVKASPLARRIAGERGIPLGSLSGSGPGGRIVKADVLSPTAAAAGAPPPEARAEGAQTQGAPAPGAPARASAGIDAVSTAKGQTTVVELTRTQQTIARRMAESKATIPDFSLQIEVDMEQCVALREELRRLAQPQREAGTAVAPTYNDMVVKACALALREHPRANAGYRDGQLQLHSRINVGVAVAVEHALIVPTVFDADEKSVGEIARETRTLLERVRSGAITPPELGGGTFTVSNLGMYGVRSFSAIINPPQAAILSVGSLERRAVVRDGELVARSTMAVTLVCDHRVLYGADAALFAARVRELLEAPASLTL